MDDCCSDGTKPKKLSLRKLLPRLNALDGGRLYPPEIAILSDGSGHIHETDGSVGFRFHTYDDLKDFLATLPDSEITEPAPAEPFFCRYCDCKVKSPTALEVELQSHETWTRCLDAIKKRAQKRLFASCDLT